MAGRPLTVAITGDVTIDWNIARVPRRSSTGTAWNAEDWSRACSQPGGAALVAELVRAVAERLHAQGHPDMLIRSPAAPSTTVHPGDGQTAHSYAMWSRFGSAGAPRAGQVDGAWRVVEYLGLDPGEADNAAAAARQGIADDPVEADIVILDDASLGFRDRVELWPRALDHPSRRPWVLLKMAHPVARGSLWERLHTQHAERLVVIVPVNDLRLMEVQVSRELSWEATAQDIFWELTHNPSVNALAHCAHVVVSFHTAGAFLLSRTPTGSNAFLFFDPATIEDEWAQQYPGGMIGYTSCLLAGLAHEFMQAPGQPDVDRGLQAGLAAVRTLHREGYRQEEAKPGRVSLAFPSSLIAMSLARPAATFAVAEVRDPARAPAGRRNGVYWTIFADRYPEHLKQLAHRIVMEGVEPVLENVPIGRFGALVTVDRREIEALRSIRSLVAEYCRQPQKRPLSIAVFGPPGSGKSFAVEQVAASVQPGQIKVLGFNLSQFHGPDELLGAFHQVRDVGLSGAIPLVFWDEFDTALGGVPLGWLRYFLAPMQDGSFLQGQITHPLGRAIFVFAGGTSLRLEAFGQGLSSDEFRGAKGPDFVSRLKGYVNILGPNRQPVEAEPNTTGDEYSIIRRAILLRAILRQRAPGLFEARADREVLNIDRGVLRAFMETREYKHGVRSLESLVVMSRLAGRGTFERSCLPPQDQLDLHVDGLEFLALVRQPELEGDLLERLAKATHDVFCAGKRRDGWTLGPEKSEQKKTHPLLVEYEELPEVYKEANRAAVRTIPRKLAAAGYVMIPARGPVSPFTFPGHDLEALARLEHELWMEAKLADGWTLGKATDDEPKRNEYLRPWKDVPESIKEIDRDLIRGIPEILAQAGYTVAKGDDHRQ